MRRQGPEAATGLQVRSFLLVFSEEAPAVVQILKGPFDSNNKLGG